MKIPISKRLLCCAAQVRKGERIADIGTDHGYLSIYLLSNQIATFAHASDLREQPLQKAIENAQRFGVSEQMHFSCADGLQAVAPESVDTVICAGMGGELIAQILAQCPWIHDGKYRLILQPQSSGNDLRRKLGEMGFGIETECLVEDGGFLYQVLCVRFGIDMSLTPGEQYVSPALLHSGDPLLPAYMQRIERALEKTVEGISKAADPDPRLEYYQTALQQIRQMQV